MAFYQNGSNENPPQKDDGTLSPIKNGNKKSPPRLDVDTIKVVVIGEPGCGKTRFIRKYYDNHFPSEINSHNGVRVYNCIIEGYNLLWKTSIFEIPGHPDFIPEQRIPHYEEAHAIVFMYAIDDPMSFQMLSEKWLLETINIIESKKVPVVIVGNKKDLRDDQQVIERLALENRSPVSLEQGREMLDIIPSKKGIVECSTYNLNNVENIFNIIFGYVLCE